MSTAPFFDSTKDWQKDFNSYLEENKTLAYMMLRKSREYKGNAALIQKNKKGEWEKITWDEFDEKIMAVAKALIDKGL